jgi:hypothetical protein
MPIATLQWASVFPGYPYQPTLGALLRLDPIFGSLYASGSKYKVHHQPEISQATISRTLRGFDRSRFNSLEPPAMRRPVGGGQQTDNKSRCGRVSFNLTVSPYYVLSSHSSKVQPQVFTGPPKIFHTPAVYLRAVVGVYPLSGGRTGCRCMGSPYSASTSSMLST